MMKQCAEPMMNVVDCTMLILDKCILAAEDGEVDAGEVRELQAWLQEGRSPSWNVL